MVTLRHKHKTAMMIWMDWSNKTTSSMNLKLPKRPFQWFYNRKPLYILFDVKDLVLRIFFDTLNSFKPLHNEIITKLFMLSHCMKCATLWLTLWEITETLVYGRYSSALFYAFGMGFVAVNVRLTPSAFGSTFWNVLTCLGVRFPAGRVGPWLSMPMLMSVSLRPGYAKIRESVGAKKCMNSWLWRRNRTE